MKNFTFPNRYFTLFTLILLFITSVSFAGNPGDDEHYPLSGSFPYSPKAWNPATVNKFTGSWHSNLYIANTASGNRLLTWGQNMSTYTSATAGDILVPTAVSTAIFAGIPIEVRSASSTGGANGLSIIVLRTTTKLYVFGTTANITTITSMAGFGAGTNTVLGGTGSDITSLLPSGVLVTDIASVEVSPTAFAIITNTGHVYILTKVANLQGDKAAAGPAIWHHVTLSDGVTFLSGVTKFSLSGSGAFALVGGTNKIYYWGSPANVAGVVNTATSYNYAYDMSATIPAGQTVNNLVVMGTNAPSASTLFLLCNNKKVYSCGLNTGGVLGVNNATVTFNQPTFITVKDATGTTDLANIEKIDGETEGNNVFTVAAIDNTGKIYGWGDNTTYGLLGIVGAANVTKGTQIMTGNGSPGTGYTDFSVAGHFIVAFQCNAGTATDKYWMMGHQLAGSLGDGTTTGANLTSPTPIIAPVGTGYACSVTPVPLPPIANNINNEPLNNSNAQTPISALTGADLDGTIANFTITTIPPAGQGVLYLCNPACSSVTPGQVILPADAAKLKFDPAPTFTGTATFNYTATDNSSTVSNPATFGIPVFNNPPTATNIITSQMSNTLGSTAIPPLNGSDPDGSVVSYTVATIPAPAEGVLYLCNPTCNPVTANQVLSAADIASLQFDPAAGFIGNTGFTYFSKDNNGNNSPAAIYVIPVKGVAPINLPPVSNNIVAPTMSNTNGPTLIPGLQSLDADGTIASYRIETIPTAAQGILTYCSNGTEPCTGTVTTITALTTLTPVQMATLKFDPAATFTGNVNFDYSALDNSGNRSNTANYSIPVTNTPPVAAPVTTPPITNTSGQTVIPPISGSDADGSISSYTVTSIPSVASGVLYLCNPGCNPVTAGQVISPADAAKLKFAPAAGFTGNGVFNYTSTDNNSNVSTPAQYTIPVVSINYYAGLPPVANNITAPAMPNTNGPTLIPGLVATDADGTIDSYKINSIPPASQGTLTYCSNGTEPCTGTVTAITVGTILTPAQMATIKFDPAAGFNGNAVFNYSAFDNLANISNMATYTIPVNGTPPIANAVTNAAIPTSAGSTPILPISGSDADGSIVGFTITSLPPAASGILYLCNPTCNPVTAGQVISPADAAKLQFDPLNTWNAPFTGFTYTSTDNNSNISSTANFTIPISGFSTLPINLISFTAIKSGKNSVLGWVTSMEINSSYFEVEHSPDGTNYSTIGIVNAAGNSSVNKQYNFTDIMPYTGINYYRLKIMNVDGKFDYSDIRFLNFGNFEGILQIYPNPAKRNVIISFNTLYQGKASLVITNAIGLQVINKPILVNTQFNVINQELNQLASGIYLVQLINDKGERIGDVQKLIKE